MNEDFKKRFAVALKKDMDAELAKSAKQEEATKVWGLSSQLARLG